MYECSIVLDALHSILNFRPLHSSILIIFLEDNVRIVQILTPYASNKYLETLLTTSILRLPLIAKN